MSAITYFWFRRDLRLHDNVGLFRALKEQTNIQPVFIFDSNILQHLKHDDARVTFIHSLVSKLKQDLQALGADLLVLHGNPLDIWTKLLHENQPNAIYCNHDYEPNAIKRDSAIEKIANENQTIFKSYKDQVIFEKSEVVKKDGLPYTVFTPYSKIWKEKFQTELLNTCDPYLHSANFHNSESPYPELSLADLNFKKSNIELPTPDLSVSTIHQYHVLRDYPNAQATSRVGMHLRFGAISIRELIAQTIQHNDIYLSELIWREFYMMILWHFPHVVERSFKPQYDAIPWLNNPDHFQAWCEGKTGYPIVDAGMRQLNKTGYMHNRVRMITASFLCKHLLIDWRLGEAYFAEKLLDFELASNNGGWQWAAGTGCDAAPYFRVFSPDAQTKKFDAKHEYIQSWVDDINLFTYPEPIVEHKTARLRAIDTYKSALNYQ